MADPLPRPISQAAPVSDRELTYLRCGNADAPAELVIVRADFQGVFRLTDAAVLALCASGTKILAGRR